MHEQDAQALAVAIERDLSGLPEPEWPFLSAAPPIRVLDCVLSLNRRYLKFVVPRVERFRDHHPEVRTCAELRARMLAAPSLGAFLADDLDVRDVLRARTLLGVTEYLIDVQTRFDGPDEAARLAAWARWARPGDYLSVGVMDFALAGFQYLRMLFGADTAKPDVHVVEFVARVVDRRVSPAHALYLLERAAELSGQSLRAIDGRIWQRRALG